MKAVGVELVDDLAQVFSLSMGWYKVVDVIEGLESRAGSNIFPPQQVNNTTLSTDTEAAFDRLEALNQSLNAAVYTQAILSLKLIFRKLEKEGNDNPHIVLEWGESMPEEFIHLLKERESLALTIAGFYCMILENVSQVWWLKGWSKGLFGVIWQKIDPLYHEVLEWPSEMLGIKT